MPWIDAYLNAAMLLGGMGPVGPELHTTLGKVFAGIYALYAGMVVLVAASIIIAPVFHRFIHRFHLEQGK
jgi:chromate transport protein ChrA